MLSHPTAAMTIADGEIGVISSVTQAFCSACTRAWLATDGKLYTLFAQSSHDSRARRGRATADAVARPAHGRHLQYWRKRLYVLRAPGECCRPPWPARRHVKEVQS